MFRAIRWRNLCWAFGLLATFSVSASAQTLAFPEAEGFGRFATGARTNLAAASVYHVTNLNDSGPGSFRDAVSQSNRFVVFDVGGIANIESVVPVASNVTIAGQTAPGGITLYNNRISFTGSNNLISRHFAVRMSTAPGRTDAASIARGTNMIFDHMSITWGVDSNFDINADSGYVIDNITIQNTIIGQGLDNVGHSTGQLVQPGGGGSVSIIKSLYADNVTRNPKARFENEFINNVVYGYLESGYIMGDTDNADSFANVEGNYFIKGSSAFTRGTSRFYIYANDNWVDSNSDGVLNGSLNTSYPGATLVGTRHAFPTTATLTAQQAVEYVAENAGVTIIRDAVDTRLMDEVLSYGTLGGIIERDSDLFPNYGTDPIYLNPRARFVDADNDGIADNWESAHGLNPADAADWKQLNGTGYTRLEEYVNELGTAGSMVTSTGGAWTTPSTWTGGVPSVADEAVATGDLSHSSGHAFARRLIVNGSLDVAGGTVDVFDTATVTNALTISGGAVTAGRILLGSSRQTGSITLETGGTLQSGTIASTAGPATFNFNGGTFRATGAPDIRVATILGNDGGTFDTGSYSGLISGAISGTGGITKRGAGSLTLSGAKTYTGPTVIEEGVLIVHGAGLDQTSGVELGSETTLDVSAVSNGLNLSFGNTLGGSGTVVGNVMASAGSVVRPEGTLGEVNDRPIGIQAEDLTLDSDWAIFDNGVHGTGAGGTYDGADLNGGGIVLVTNDRSGVAPVATGVASTIVTIPETKTWYLYAKTAEPTVSPIAGDPATQPGGNNSFFASSLSGSLQASTSNYEEIQTLATPGNAATWTLVSPNLSPLSGVNGPLNAGIDYVLSSGEQPFSIYGREVGTIIDGFVLSDTNLTVEELEEALSGGGNPVLTIEGNFTQTTGALFELEVAGGDVLNQLVVTGSATLGGDLSISLADGFVPQASDEFSILEAGDLVGQFDNAAPGARIPTADRGGSFVVNYDFAQDTLSLSSYAAAIPGDFNFDLVVNNADLEWWQNNYGVTATGADFLTWQRNFGAAAGSIATVPEPAGLTLLVNAVGIAAAVLRTLRR